MQTNTIFNQKFQELIGKKYPKAFKKWLNRCLDTKSPWTENDIIYFRKYIRTLKDQDLSNTLWDAFFETSEKEITPEQTKKGIEYITKVCFRKDGTLRKTKDQPFSLYNAQIIKDFERFTFVDLRDIGNYMSCYVPVYRVYSKSGEWFDYSAGTQGQMEVLR